jgi:hypothetical protein
MAKRIEPILDAEEYPSIQQRAPRDFPKTYEEWLAIAEQHRAGLVAAGHEIVEVAVSLQELDAYCQRTSQAPSQALLGAAAIFKRERGGA